MAGPDRRGVAHHVLLVGAADDLRDVMETILRSQGNTVTCTDDAAHALTMATLRHFHAIVIERGRPDLPTNSLVDRLVSNGLTDRASITTYAATNEVAASEIPSMEHAHSSNP